MQGKLNLFQATMLRWRELHPYNAVHVVVVEQALQPARLSACIASVLETAGLTGLILSRRRARFVYRGGPAAVSVFVLSSADDARRVVEQETERALNEPFAPDGAIAPFRFFAVDAGGSFHLGLAYDHFIAGGDSITLLLGRIVAIYATGSEEAAPLSAHLSLPFCTPCGLRDTRTAPRPGDGRKLPQVATGAVLRRWRREQRFSVAARCAAGRLAAVAHGAQLGRHAQRPILGHAPAGAGLRH